MRRAHGLATNVTSASLNCLASPSASQLARVRDMPGTEDDAIFRAMDVNGAFAVCERLLFLASSAAPKSARKDKRQRSCTSSSSMGLLAWACLFGPVRQAPGKVVGNMCSAAGTTLSGRVPPPSRLRRTSLDVRRVNRKIRKRCTRAVRTLHTVRALRVRGARLSH